MTNRPWPDEHNGEVLFVLDAAHVPEQDLLVRWLAETEPEGGYSGAQHRVVLPIATRQEHIEAKPLMARLDAPDDTLVVPLRVVWRDDRPAGRSTPRFRDLLRGNRRRPGASRAARLLRRNPDAARCIAGNAATLGALRQRFHEERGEDSASPEAFAQFIGDQAGLVLDIAERQLRGGRYKVPRRVASNMQKSRRYRRALEEVSRQTGTPVEVLRERSEEIFDELIAIPRTFWQDVLAAFNRKIISMGYQPDFVVDQDSIRRLREVVRHKPAVLLWTHKTHIDGFAVYSMLFENDFPVPHVLGGVNMAFAGLGYAARRSGAIFIRRSFQDDLLYKMILRQYIGYLLEKRFPLTWAFEGTRSRVGKLMPPRYGLLKYVVEAAEATGSDDLHIIPVALNYDLIRDVKDYVREQSGAVKQPESLRWFIGYLRGLRQPLGKIYIDFGDPVVVSDPTDDDLALKKIAFQVGVEANRVTPLTLSSLVTTILLGNAPRALTRLELGKEMLRYLNWARDRGVRVTADFDRDNLQDFNALADVLDKHGLVSHFDEGPDTVYTLAPEQHAVASYYRNTTIHHFVIKAFIELALIRVSRADDDDRVALFWREADLLRDLFKFEFFYAPRDAFHDEVDRELSRYDGDWSKKLASDPSFAGNFLGRFRPLVARAALLPFIEAYRVVANVVSRLEPGEGIEQKECVKQSLALAKQAYLQRRISSEASIVKLFFENAFRLMENMGLTVADYPPIDAERQKMGREFRDLANCLERLRVLALPGDDW